MAISTLNKLLKMVIRDKASTKASWNTALRKGKIVMSSEKAKFNIFFVMDDMLFGLRQEVKKKTRAIQGFIEETPKFLSKIVLKLLRHLHFFLSLL